MHETVEPVLRSYPMDMELLRPYAAVLTAEAPRQLVHDLDRAQPRHEFGVVFYWLLWLSSCTVRIAVAGGQAVRCRTTTR